MAPAVASEARTKLPSGIERVAVAWGVALGGTTVGVGLGRAVGVSVGISIVGLGRIVGEASKVNGDGLGLRGVAAEPRMEAGSPQLIVSRQMTTGMMKRE
jgi:hypothetical protein